MDAHISRVLSELLIFIYSQNCNFGKIGLNSYLLVNNEGIIEFVNTYLMDRNFSFFKRLKESDK